MTQSDSERRTFSRITFDADITLTQGGNSWKATLVDISLKGILVEEPANWDADITQYIDAHIALDDETAIDMTLNWRHTQNGQIGFECDHIDIDSVIHLRRLVELNLGDEELLERELAALGH